MIVAEIAWRDLQPAVRKRANELLKLAEPAYRDPLPAACWADDFKGNGDAHWHYINLPFRKGNTTYPFSQGEENVVWAIRRFSAILGKKNEAPEVRKVALVWLLHFVGDVHQPLHATSRTSAAWPSGDRGGNEYKIRTPEGWQTEVRNLHFLWDIGCGAYGRVDRPLTQAGRLTIAGYANSIVRNFPRKSIPRLAESDPRAWARESRDIAVDFVYSTPEGQAPSREYLRKGDAISRKRLATAGYRLADVLNRLLK